MIGTPDVSEVLMNLYPSPSSSKRALRAIRPLIEDQIPPWLLEEEIYELRLALAEALANIADHAYGNYSGERVELRARFVTYSDGAGIEIELSDTGIAPDPDRFISRDPDDLRAGGLGLCLMSEVMDRVRMRVLPDRNVLSLTRFFLPKDARLPNREPFHILERSIENLHEIWLYGSAERIWPFELDGVVAPRLRLDLAHIHFIDSAAVREILALGERLRDSNSVLEISRVPERIRRILMKTSLLVPHTAVPARITDDAPAAPRADILLIERDELFIRQVRKSAGANSVRVARTEAAVNREISRALPDLALLSMDLAGNESERIFWSFRSEPARIEVPLIITGDGRSFAPFRDEVDDFCPLPIESTELNFRIRRAIERSRNAGTSLSLLRALGSRYCPEALENISEQIEDLKELGALFLTVENFNREKSPPDAPVFNFDGWMRWGPLSFGSFVRVVSDKKSCTIVFGRGSKTGVASIMMGATISGLIEIEPESDLDSVAHELAASVRRLIPFVDPYYVAFASFQIDRGWMFHTSGGPAVASMLSADGQLGSIGSYRVDQPPSQLLSRPPALPGGSACPAPWGFLAPGFLIDDVRTGITPVSNAPFDLWAMQLKPVENQKSKIRNLVAA